MTKSSNDMIKLTKIIETSDDIKATLGKLMWANCKACHSKFRAPH
jgi:cytochrome c556